MVIRFLGLKFFYTSFCSDDRGVIRFFFFFIGIGLEAFLTLKVATLLLTTV